MTILVLVLLILADYRISRLIARDGITDPFRHWLGRLAAQRKPGLLLVAELFHCPYCLGLWFGGLFAFFHSHSLGEWLLFTLAIAGGQCLVQEMVDHA